MPASQAHRDSVRADVVRLAGEGRLVVPIARTFPLADALKATALLMGGHPGGKFVLANDEDLAATDTVRDAPGDLSDGDEGDGLEHSAEVDLSRDV